MKTNNPLTLEEWLEKISGQMGQIIKALEAKKLTLADLGLIDTHDLCLLLNITPRTVANWRKTGEIRFSKKGGRYYYKISDIKEMMEEGFQRA
jgi:hypothetical protein